MDEDKQALQLLQLLEEIPSPLPGDDGTLDAPEPPPVEDIENIEDIKIVKEHIIEEPTLTIVSPPAKTPSTDLFKGEKDTDDLGIKNLLVMFNDSITEIIKNQKVDRSQADEGITMVKGRIQNMIESDDCKGIGVFLDAYARMLQTKADVNSNANRALDSIAKLLSASKSNDLIPKTQDSSGGLDLERLLAMSDDD